MSKDTKIEREKGQPVDGKTDYERLKNMTEEEIEKNAQNDPDAPLQSEEDLKRFKRVHPKKEK
jgi:hypothetical protein